MPWPNVNGYGIIENPLVFTPFGQNNGPSPTPLNAFLLMDGTHFHLMDGSDFLLMG